MDIKTIKNLHTLATRTIIYFSFTDINGDDHEICATYHIEPGYRGDRYSPPEPANLIIDDILGYNINDEAIAFDYEETYSIIDDIVYYYPDKIPEIGNEED